MASLLIHPRRISVECAFCRNSQRYLYCVDFFNRIAAGKPCVPTRCPACGIRYHANSRERLSVMMVRRCLGPENIGGWGLDTILMDPAEVTEGDRARVRRMPKH